MRRVLASVLLLAGCASQAAAPGSTPPLPTYQDGSEYYVPSYRGKLSPAQVGTTGVTRYFLTNTRRICFGFEVPGAWQLGHQPALLRRLDGKGMAAVWLYSLDDLGGGSVEAAIRKAAENSGKLYAKESGGVAWTLTPYEGVPGAWQWTLPVEIRAPESVPRVLPRWYLPVGERWIAQFMLGVPPEVERDAFITGVLRSLTTSREPRCYEARLRELGGVR